MLRLRVALVSVLVLSAGACAQADRSVSLDSAAGGTRLSAGAALLASAASTPTEARTGRFSLTTEVSGDTTYTATLTGAFDLARNASSVTARGQGGSQAIALSSVTLDGVVYLETGEFGRTFGAKTDWVSLDVTNLAKKAGVPLDHDPTGSAASDPQTFADLLRGVSGSVTTVGTEVVRGTSTTHLRATVIPSKALARVPAARRSKLGGRLGAALDEPVPVDAWVDGAGRLRRLRYSRHISDGVTYASTFELFDLGGEVTITAPPASQVTPVEQLPILRKLLGN